VPEFQAACRDARQQTSFSGYRTTAKCCRGRCENRAEDHDRPDCLARNRLQAAEIVLEHATRAGEIDQTEDRLAQLERIENVGKSVGPSPGPALLRATPTVGSTPTYPRIGARDADAEINEDGTE